MLLMRLLQMQIKKQHRVPDQPKEPKNEEPKTEDTFSEVGMKDTPEEPTDLDHPA